MFNLRLTFRSALAALICGLALLPGCVPDELFDDPAFRQTIAIGFLRQGLEVNDDDVLILMDFADEDDRVNLYVIPSAAEHMQAMMSAPEGTNDQIENESFVATFAQAIDIVAEVAHEKREAGIGDVLILAPADHPILPLLDDWRNKNDAMPLRIRTACTCQAAGCDCPLTNY